MFGKCIILLVFLHFGATAINPYLALSTIRNLKITGKLETDVDPEILKKNYVKAVCDGLLKVFSKMGISTFSLTKARR